MCTATILLSTRSSSPSPKIATEVRHRRRLPAKDQTTHRSKDVFSVMMALSTIEVKGSGWKGPESPSYPQMRLEQ